MVQSDNWLPRPRNKIDAPKPRWTIEFESRMMAALQFYFMKIKIFIRFIFAFVFLASGIRVFSQDESLGQFDGHGDIGSPAISGSANFDPTNQTYTLTGGGVNIWGKNDQFQFLWKKMKGDFIVRARVEFVGNGVAEHRKIGWMARSSLESNASFADAAFLRSLSMRASSVRRSLITCLRIGSIRSIASRSHSASGSSNLVNTAVLRLPDSIAAQVNTFSGSA